MQLKILTTEGWMLIPMKGELTEDELKPFKKVMGRYGLAVLPPGESVRIFPTKTHKKREVLKLLKSLNDKDGMKTRM